MKCSKFLLLVGLFIHYGTSYARTGFADAASVKQQLIDLSPTEASALLIKVKEAQSSLKGGQFQPYELLAGSVASYEATNISPREAFMVVPFDQVWRIERVRTDNGLWQPYKLAYAPKGMGQLYWDIEVVLGINGNIERELMVYNPPAPF